MEFIFIHKEWIDKCILDKDNYNIQRKNIQNEEGSFYKENNNFIIKWNNWESKDTFEKINEYYIHIDLKENIKYNLKKTILNYSNNKEESIIINKKYIYNLNLYKVGKINNLDIDSYFIIKWKTNNENIKNNKNIFYFDQDKNQYYELSTYINFINNNNNNINDPNLINNNKNLKKFNDLKNYNNDIFEINNSEFLSNNTKENNSTHIFKKIDNSYCNLDYIELFIEKKKINYNILNKQEIILNNNYRENYFNYIDYLNYNYVDKNNFLKYKNHYFPNFNLLNDKFLSLKLNININFNTQKKSILTICEWGYPAFGGGENWLLNMNKIFYNLNYEPYMICFSDGFKGESFQDFNYIKLDYLHIIQMPFDYLNIFKLIQIIQPNIINHQGIKRIEIMKIANILEIPFITGFCFWNNILKENFSNIKILENKQLEKDLEFLNIEKNSYVYASSDYVNDVIYKFFDKKIDVIQTISLKDDYYITSNDEYYVTLLNCHHNKGGFLLERLIRELHYQIPLLLVYTEFDDKLNLEHIKKLIDERNSINNINKLFLQKQEIKSVYSKSKIILIPSLCDETFCRVAYEAKMNNIPIISTKSGNLKYLLNDYALFLDEDIDSWISNIQDLYFKKNVKNNFKHQTDIKEEENKIQNKINDIIQQCTKSKYKLNDKHIGIIVPWADQGLGIQARSYYNTLKKIGFNPHIFSFRPYHGNDENNYLQHDPNEWKFDNVFYSKNIRENIDYHEIINFVHNNNIKKIIFIEATFEPIFNIACLLKMMNVDIYLIVNIECVKISEINYHHLFDKIFCNNYNSYFIMKELLSHKCHHLGFHLEHEFTQNNVKKNKNDNILKFVSIGGLNSISRKNIDKIIYIFDELLLENNYTDIELNVFIQGVEIFDQFKNIKHKNITIIIQGFSYQENLKNIFNNDIFIHLGGQEGLGLGFYEALYLGLPILTLDWTPNNEIIKHNDNGWLIQCSQDKIYENEECIVQRGIFKEIDLKNILIEIINNKDSTNKIINNTINKAKYFKFENKKIFQHLFHHYLSTTPRFNQI